MHRQQKTTHWDNPLASDNQVYGPSKELRGLSSCQDPHIHYLSALSQQRANKNIHSLNTARQVTMCHKLSWYRVFHYFLTPSFVLLGASAKSRCLGKLSHPSVTGRQMKTMIFISKMSLTTKSQFLMLPPCGPTPPPNDQKVHDYCHLTCHSHLYPSWWLLLTTSCRLGPQCT